MRRRSLLEQCADVFGFLFHVIQNCLVSNLQFMIFEKPSLADSISGFPVHGSGVEAGDFEGLEIEETPAQ